MNKYPRSVPICPTCNIQSGLEQCVLCGRDYKLKAKRDAARAAKAEAERIASLIPLRVSCPEDGVVRIYFRNPNGAPVTIMWINLEMKGRKKWKNTFHMVEALREEGYTNIKEAIKSIKTRRYQYRNRSKSCRDFAKNRNIEIWAHAVVGIESQGLTCVDNVRYARMSDRGAMRRYYKQKRDGCCGSMDFVKRCPFDWLRKYMIGFNYGH